MKFDPVLLTFIAGPFVAIVTGFVTRQNASSTVKSVVNVFLSALAAVAIQANHNNGILTQATVVQGFQVFVTGIASYYGFLKPTSVAAKVAAVAPELGVG